MSAAKEKPFKVIKTWKDEDGQQWVKYRADHWDGGSTADEEGKWVTSETVVGSKFPRNKVCPSVSYWPQLKRALGL